MKTQGNLIWRQETVKDMWYQPQRLQSDTFKTGNYKSVTFAFLLWIERGLMLHRYMHLLIMKLLPIQCTRRNKLRLQIIICMKHGRFIKERDLSGQKEGPLCMLKKIRIGNKIYTRETTKKRVSANRCCFKPSIFVF